MAEQDRCLARPSEASWACWPSQRRLGALPAIIDEFARLLAAHRGEETAQVTSAVPLDDAQLGSVREAVASYAGRPVQLTAAVDPSLLGGGRRADRLAHDRRVAQDQTAQSRDCR